MVLLIHMELIESFGVEFAAVPAGTFQMGLGIDEETEARRISAEPRIWWDSVRPVRQVSVAPLWISTSPVTRAQFVRLTSSKGLSSSPAPHAASPVARATFEDAEMFAREMGARLPKEVEWEYVCRAGMTGLFAFGEWPEKVAHLEPWMSWNGGVGPRNAFGLRTLFTGEWCADAWRERYGDESTERPGVHVIRGGGAYFWPWQDEEWTWCMSATRSPSTELPEDAWSFRLVFDQDPRLRSRLRASGSQ